MSTNHTPGHALQVRIGRPHTYLVHATESGHVVRVLGADGVWRKVSSENIRASAIYAYRAAIAAATGEQT